MSSYTGSPKPLNRPTLNEGIFKFVESETVVKGRSPLQAQRDADGTPITRGALSALRPPQPKLTLREEDIVTKSSKESSPAPEVDRERSEDTTADRANEIAKAMSTVSSFLMSKGVKLPIAF